MLDKVEVHLSSVSWQEIGSPSRLTGEFTQVLSFFLSFDSGGSNYENGHHGRLQGLNCLIEMAFAGVILTIAK